MIKCYDDISKLKTFEERFEYLKLDGHVGESTFGYSRYLNQIFYRSREWRKIRDQVIIRDNGCDLGIEGREIADQIYIHHMNPLTPKDIEERTDFLVNPEYLICVTKRTHDAIHYSSADILAKEPVVRRPNDTSPWRSMKNEQSEHINIR